MFYIIFYFYSFIFLLFGIYSSYVFIGITNRSKSFVYILLKLLLFYMFLFKIY